MAIDGLASLGWQRTLALAFTAALGLGAIVGSGGGGIDAIYPNITAASVDPNPVPAPTAERPVPFRLLIKVHASNGSVTVLVPKTSANPPDYAQLVRVSCKPCDGELIEIACTSSLSTTSPTERILSCAGGDAPVPYAARIDSWVFSSFLLISGAVPAQDSRSFDVAVN